MLTSAGEPLVIGGHLISLRSIRGDDEQRLTDFHATLSKASTYRRFLSYHPTLSPDELHRFTHVDGEDRVALVVLADDAIVGVGRYDRDPNRRDTADVAFVVTDEWQGEHLGTLLITCLVNAALTHGIEWFTADTLTTNAPMMHVFRTTGFPLSVTHDHGVSHVEFPISTLAQLRGWKDDTRAPRDHHTGLNDAAKRARRVGTNRSVV